MIIISDAGPLIGLAKCNSLHILKSLFERVKVPPSVFQELKTSSSRPGTAQLKDAIETSGWLQVSGPVDVPKILLDSLGEGEAEAIVLAKMESLVLLIDERKGRRVALKENLRITGTGSVLVAAKMKEIISDVSPILDQLVQTGYRLSDSLRKKILELARED
jgi:predicted nucleic acid-binding protein